MEKHSCRDGNVCGLRAPLRMNARRNEARQTVRNAATRLCPHNAHLMVRGQSYKEEIFKLKHWKMLFPKKNNKPGTAKVGAISKAQNFKRGTLWALWNSRWLQNMKKELKGALERFWKISEKKLKVSQCRKMWKGGPFGIFWHPLCCKISKQTKGRPFGGIQKSSKKVAQCRKKSEWKTPKVSYVFKVLDVDVFVLDEFLTFRVCFGRP